MPDTVLGLTCITSFNPEAALARWYPILQMGKLSSVLETENNVRKMDLRLTWLSVGPGCRLLAAVSSHQLAVRVPVRI